MTRSNRFVSKGVLRLALGFGGLLMMLSPAAALSVPTSVAQLNPNPGIFNEPPFNRIPRSSPSELTAPSSPITPSSTNQEQPPVTSIATVNGKVTIRFINTTGAVIDYEVLGQTEARTLAGRSEVSLQGLDVPTTFTFRRQDKGFLQVTLQENNPETGTLTLSVQETPDFATDRTSMYIDPAGQVFLN